MLSRLGDAIQFVLRNILGQPVAAVVGEVQLLGGRIPVEADRVTHAACVDLHAGAIEIHAADLRMLVARHHVIAGLTHRNVELVVRADGDELPAMRLVLRQVVIDHCGLRWIVELVLDILDLGNFRKLRDIERAVVIGEPVRTIETGGENLSILVDDGIDLVHETAANEDRAFIPDAHGAGIRHAGCIDLDVESRRQLQLGRGQLVGGSRNRRCGDRRKLGRIGVVRTSDQR